MGSEGFCSQRWSMSLRVKIASIWTHLCAYPLLRYSMACLTNLHRLLVMVWMLGILCCFVGGSQTMTAQQMALRFWSKLLWNSLHKLTAEHSCWSVHSDPVSSLRRAQQAHVLGLSPDQPSRHPPTHLPSQVLDLWHLPDRSLGWRPPDTEEVTVSRFAREDE